MDMDAQILQLRKWLGTGSINIFGLPMSGKDTVGVRLASVLGAKFLSSGMIIRAVEQETGQNFTGNGQLAPTEVFSQYVLPYFNREDLRGFPLVLSSIGRWSGEENQVIIAADDADHPIKAAVWLKLSEADVLSRWQTAQTLNDRGNRTDDKDLRVFQTRLAEFNEKTVPVLSHYHKLGGLVQVKADMFRDEVFAAVISELYKFSQQSLSASPDSDADSDASAVPNPEETPLSQPPAGDDDATLRIQH